MMIIRTSSIFAFLVLLMIESAAGQALVKPGCQESCGNVDSIPYPFGIGTGCYKNKWFEVSCSQNETSQPPTTLLTSIDIEVLHFSLDPSIVAVKRPIGNYSETIPVKSVNLSGSPFTSSLGERLSFRPRKYVPDIFTWLIFEEDVSQLPHTHPDAFHCSPAIINSYPDSLLFYTPSLVPSGTQFYNSSMPPKGSLQCVCGRGFHGNPYLPSGCKGKLFSS
ncbi:hypothetical protein SLA2020_125060 [Shorea laevis]